MTSIALRTRRTPDVPLSRREWNRLPATSPAKSVTPRFATAALIAAGAIVLAVVVVASYRTVGGPASVAGGAIAGAVLAAQSVSSLDRLMRWRSYLSLFSDQPARR